MKQLQNLGSYKDFILEQSTSKVDGHNGQGCLNNSFPFQGK